MSPKRTSHPRLKSLFLWHRYMGLCAALFVLVLSTTGLLLNHTADLDLDQQHLANELLLDWYGVPKQFPARAYGTANHWVINIDQRVYLGDKPMVGMSMYLVGVSEFQQMVVLADEHQLALLTPSGELVERIDAGQGLPCTPQSIGLTTQPRLVIRCKDGSQQESEDLLNWQPSQSNVNWSKPATAPQAMLDAAQRHARHSVLTLERALLDLHSGRLFGRAGVWLFDIAGVLMLLLAGTGVWHWAKRKRK